MGYNVINPREKDLRQAGLFLFYPRFSGRNRRRPQAPEILYHIGLAVVKRENCTKINKTFYPILCVLPIAFRFWMWYYNNVKGRRCLPGGRTPVKVRIGDRLSPKKNAKNLLTNPLKCDTIRMSKEMVGRLEWLYPHRVGWDTIGSHPWKCSPMRNAGSIPAPISTGRRKTQNHEVLAKYLLGKI